MLAAKSDVVTLCNKQIVVMKKIFRMAMVLPLVCGVLAFTGCTDYEDDINSLGDRITAVENALTELQSKINDGAVITSVTQSANGITITLSDGETYEITNGKDGANGADGADGADGAPGTVVEIGDDGYWYIDNVKTEYPATGVGAAGKDAPTVYYEPGTEGDEKGFWVKVTEEKGKEPVRDVTDITWLPEGTLTAVWNAETKTLYIYNAEGSADGEPVVISSSTGMVTSVELVLSYTSPQQDDAPVLKFSTVTEQANVFEDEGWDGQVISNGITFTKGAQTQTESSFVVRVSPANAVLTADMVSLVNSKGENLDDFVTVTKVEKYNELLTRAADNSGLWKVSVALQSYNKDTFNAKRYANGKDDTKGEILYAVQVNNTKEGDADRYVTSSYDVTLDHFDYTPADKLGFIVSNSDHSYNVVDLNNRYKDNSISLLNPSTSAAELAPEYKWKSTPAVTPVFSGSKANAVKDAGDDRSLKNVFPAVQGEEITISLTTETTGTKVTAPDNIRAIYVTLDKEDNAIESVPSEWNAWNSYVYTGLNTVVEGTEVTITINPAAGQSILNDFIGFRVFAVNYDGTLVDPDGKAFYVKIGDEAVVWNTVATTIIPDAKKSTAPNTEKSADATVSGLTKISGAVSATWLDEAGKTPMFNAVFKAGKDEVYSTDDLTSFPADSKNFDKVTAVYTQPTSAVTEWSDLKDDKAYNGILTIYDADNFVLATVTVTMTKKLPSVPAGFSIKTNQLDANGIYNCYLVPDSWAVPVSPDKPEDNFGTMDMDDVFNWGEGVISQYEINFAKAAYDSKDKVVDNKVAGNADLEVDNDFIDNKTQHTTVVTYNFGKISSEEKDNSGRIIDYAPEVYAFPTVFSCIYNDTYTWHWASIEEIADYYGAPWDGEDVKAPSTELVYGIDYTFADPNGAEFSFDAVIKGVSSKDSKYSAWLEVPYEGSLLLQEIGGAGSGIWGQVITNDGEKVNEYFQVSKDPQGRLFFDATSISDDTNPTGPVPSTLRLVYMDMYGHEVPVELDVTVVKR